MLEILSNEFDMAAEERAEADNEKDRTFNAGEIHCARRSTRKVNDLPAVDAVPVVHARWIDLRESHKDIPKIECSNCRTMIIGLESKFCPKCGARMDAEEDR